ncbi:hypothetical protein EDM68_01565 [Candidatus Uhrbacteria bacterium]|nr:MAG: hypothetical protein EDM68_01565 [Candidatus Uhrbacteria bacterium]
MSDSNMFAQFDREHSVMTGVPKRPAPEPMFEKLLALALALGIPFSDELVRKIPLGRVLEALRDDPKRLAQVFARVFFIQDLGFAEAYVKAYADRIERRLSEALNIDPNAARRLYDALGAPFYIQNIPLVDIFLAVMGTGWHLKDIPEHRKLAGGMSEALADYKAFGADAEGQELTEKSIMRAIGLKELFGDRVPAELRVQMADAVDRGLRTPLSGGRMHNVIFNPKFNGVKLTELANHLPPEVMIRPFEAFAKLHDIVAQAPVDLPSELPPANIVAQVEATIPKAGPPPFVPPPAALEGEDDV